MSTNNTVVGLVNGVYPPDYFTLQAIDPIKAPNHLWWSSRQRFAAVNPNDPSKYLAHEKGGIPTSEYLEIDLGRVRPINYLNLSVLKAPIRITVEYDAVSPVDTSSDFTDDIHTWVSVTPVFDAQFDDDIHYEPQHKNPWHNAEFYFTDIKGNPVATQYLRLRFRRKDSDWPVKNATPFRWPILVKNARSARYILSLKDTIGPLFDSPPSSTVTTPDILSGVVSHDLRQQFTMPADAVRGGIDPDIMGFGVFCQVPTNNALGTAVLDEFQMQWSLWDITDTPTQVRQGIETKAIASPFSWIDVYFDPFNPVATDVGDPRVYELRVSSLNTDVSPAFSTQPVKYIPGVALNGTYTFTTGSPTVTTGVDVTGFLTPNEYIQKATRLEGVWKIQSVSWNGSISTITLTQSFVGTTEAVPAIRALPLTHFNNASSAFVSDFTNALTMRLWGDVGDSGRDILGNSYRYGTHRDKADSVLDNTLVGWQSAPQPSPEAVEALYFDVRTIQNGVPISTMIDAVRVAPRTPGVRMHIYYTEANRDSVQDTDLRTPQSRNEWDQLLWRPVNATYTLKKDQIFTLPKPVRAGFIKLEFSNLKPQPWRSPSRPNLPPVQFRRYPTWIESEFANSTIRRVVEDWFVKNKTRVSTKILKTLTEPIQEFQFKEREFLAALALGKVKANNSNANIINTTQRSLIDPVTGSKIQVNTKDMYKSTLVVNIDRDSVLGSVVESRFDPNLPTDSVEGFTNTTAKVPTSSTPNNRIKESFGYLARTPMWFNRLCRHIYKIDTASFGAQAFYVGIEEVEFLRKDYTIFRDDAIIQDNLTDTDQLEENTFIPNTPSLIANAIYGNDTQTGHIVNTVTTYASYTVLGTDFADEQVVFTSLDSSIPLNGRGDVAQNVSLTSAPSKGGTQYQYGVDFDIVYSTDPVLGNTVNNVKVANFSNKFVVSRGANNTDANTMLGRAIVSAEDIYIPFDAVTVGTAVGVVIGFGIPTALDKSGHTESLTATGVAVPSASEIYTTAQNIDAATVTGIFPPATSSNLPINAEAITFGDSTVSVVEFSGVGLHQGSPPSDTLDTSTIYSTYPDLELFSVWVKWSTLQPTSRASFTWPAALDASLDHAMANGYKIVLRIACGADTPAWVYTDPTNPVSSLKTIATDLTTGAITMPVPWDPDLLVLYTNMLTLLQPKIDQFAASGLTPGGTRRSDYIELIPVSMCMETDLGCGMELTYGAAATYTGTATLAGNITGTTASFTATNANAQSYPTSPFLAKIDNELLYVTRTGGSDVLTVQSSGRGWSGSTATSHTTGTTVQWANSVPWTGTFNALNGPYDVSVQNQTQWLTLGTVTANKASLLAAWQTAIDANVVKVTNFSAIPSVISYGKNFDDNWANAQIIAQAKTAQYPVALWGMVSDLQPGRDGGNNPTKNGRATYYEGYSAAAGVTVRLVQSNGGTLGFQAAPASVYTGFTTPFVGGGSAFRVTIDDTISVFAPEFIMIDGTILSS